MHRKKKQKITFFVALTLLVVGWGVLFFLYNPAELAGMLGVTNSYLVAFFLAIIGAVGSLTSVSTYPAIFTMAAGGVNPVGLVAISAVGLTIGDFLFIYLGRSARAVLSDSTQQKAHKLLAWLYRRPVYFTQGFLFLWVGFSPLANNLLTAPMAVTNFPPRKMVIPILLGNVVLPTVAVTLGILGIEWWETT